MRPTPVLPFNVLRCSKVMQQIVVRLDEMKRGGWEVSSAKKGYGTNWGVLTSKSGKKIRAFNNTEHFKSGWIMPKQVLNSYLKTISKCDADTNAVANRPRNERKIAKAQEFFSEQKQAQVPKVVEELYPDLEIHELVEVMNEAQQLIAGGRAKNVQEAVTLAADIHQKKKAQAVKKKNDSMLEKQRTATATS